MSQQRVVIVRYSNKGKGEYQKILAIKYNINISIYIDIINYDENKKKIG